MSKKLRTNVTVHNLDTGESRTFGPDDDLPGWAREAITNPDVWEAPEEEKGPVPGPSQSDVHSDLIGTGTDPLMELRKDKLLELAEAVDAEDVSDANTKAEIVAAIRETGYDGDGSDLVGE